jgi:hypothetical protein
LRWAIQRLCLHLNQRTQITRGVVVDARMIVMAVVSEGEW